MNLLADESVDTPIVDRLRQDGHSVRYIAESDPGIHDDAVLDQANRSGDFFADGRNQPQPEDRPALDRAFG